jgi:hypothetical protein
MHYQCAWCQQPAMQHRMTDTGNFYCLEISPTSRWKKTVQQSWTPEQRRQWATSIASCSELRKARIPKEVGQVLVANLRGHVSAIADTQLLP